VRVEREVAEQLRNYLSCTEGVGWEEVKVLWVRVRDQTRRAAALMVSEWRKAFRALMRISDMVTLHPSLLYSASEFVVSGVMEELADRTAAAERTEEQKDRLASFAEMLKEAGEGQVTGEDLEEKPQTFVQIVAERAESVHRLCTDREVAHAAVAAALFEKLREGIPGHLSALLRESVWLSEFIGSRLRRLEVWTDGDLQKFHTDRNEQNSTDRNGRQSLLGSGASLSSSSSEVGGEGFLFFAPPSLDEISEALVGEKRLIETADHFDTALDTLKANANEGVSASGSRGLASYVEAMSQKLRGHLCDD